MKKIIITILSIIVLGVIGFFVFFNKPVEEIDLINVNGEPGVYFTYKLDKNFKFELISNTTEVVNQSIELYDDYANRMTLNLKTSVNNITILPPDGGYTEGRIYKLLLPDGIEFKSDDFREVRVLNFQIEKEEVTILESVSGVKTIENVNIFDESSGSLVINDSIVYNKDDIVFFKDPINKDIQYVYQIDQVDRNGTTQDLKLKDANIDEVYSYVEVYKEIELDENYITIDEDEIIDYVRMSGAFDKFFTDVNAKDTKKNEFKVNVKGAKKGGVEIEVTYNTFTAIFTLKSRAIVNINGLDNVSTVFKNTIGVRVEFKGTDESKLKSEDLIKKFKNGELVNNINELLTEKSVDKAKFSNLDFIGFKIPIAGTINYFVEGGLDFSFNPSIEIDFNDELVLESTTVMRLLGTEFTTLQDFKKINQIGDVDMVISTKIEACFYIAGGIELIPGSKVGLKASFNPYVSATGFIKLNKEELNGVGEIKIAYYPKLDAYISMNLLLTDINATYEIAKGNDVEIFKISNVNKVEDVRFPEEITLDQEGKFLPTPIVIYYKNIFDDTISNDKLFPDQYKLDSSEFKLTRVDDYYKISDLSKNDSKLKLNWVKDTIPLNYDLTVDFVYYEIQSKLVNITDVDEIYPLTSEYSGFKKGEFYGIIRNDGTIIQNNLTRILPSMDEVNIYAANSSEGSCMILDINTFEFNGDYCGYGGYFGPTSYFMDTNRWKIYDIGEGGELMEVNYEIKSKVSIIQEVRINGRENFYTYDYDVYNKYALGSISSSYYGTKIDLLTGFDYNDVTGFGWREGISGFRDLNNKWGFFDKNGSLIISHKYDQIVLSPFSWTYPFEQSNYVSVQYGDYWQMIDKADNAIYSSNNVEFMSDMLNDVFWTKNEEGWTINKLIKH